VYWGRGLRSAPGSNTNQQRTRRNRAEKPHRRAEQAHNTTLALLTHMDTHTWTHTHAPHITGTQHTSWGTAALRKRPPIIHTPYTTARALMHGPHTHTHMHTHTDTMHLSPSQPLLTLNTGPHPAPKVPCSCVSGCCTLLGGCALGTHASRNASTTKGRAAVHTAHATCCHMMRCKWLGCCHEE
jgi:hypothetical protein